ncbi:hypothetical protein J6590_009489 [Homalodisca vitripennis]|nr:hypothetical protein J6590_009489 [Homalodisca vitripennis]
MGAPYRTELAGISSTRCSDGRTVSDRVGLGFQVRGVVMGGPYGTELGWDFNQSIKLISSQRPSTLARHKKWVMLMFTSRNGLIDDWGSHPSLHNTRSPTTHPLRIRTRTAKPGCAVRWTRDLRDAHAQ